LKYIHAGGELQPNLNTWKYIPVPAQLWEEHGNTSGLALPTAGIVNGGSEIIVE